MRIQKQLGNGSWIDANEAQLDRIIELALQRDREWSAVREGRAPMTTRQEVLDYLATGREYPYADDWYMNVRDADAIKPRQAKPVELIKCSCGHSVSKALVMSASMGSSCPDCYDRMSD